MTLDPSIFVRYWPILLQGFLLTLGIAIVAPPLALVLGVGLAALRLSRRRVVAVAAQALSEVVRDLPFMVLLFLIFYLSPRLGLRLPALGVGLVTLCLYGAAYFAEIVRGAVRSVPPGQMESARATGMTRLQAYRHVVVPQMLGYFIPPATSQAVLVVKDSAVLSTVTVGELTMAGQIVQGYTYSPIEVFGAVSILYWILCTAISRLGAALEARLGPPYRRRMRRA